MSLPNIVVSASRFLHRAVRAALKQRESSVKAARVSVRAA